MQIHVVDTGFFKLDGGAMFGVVPKSIWQKINPADANNMCTWAMRCLLIEQGNRLMLIDTGIGNKQDERFFKHYFLHGQATLQSSLKQKGFSPDDITDVLLTHLHFDHVGGAVSRNGDKLVPTFKNATYWSNEAHWDWAEFPNAREKASFLKDNFLPIRESGQLRFVNTDGSFEIEGVQLLFVDGHTEKMMLPKISIGSKNLLYCADLIPSAGHVRLPYIMAYDMRPLQTLSEKQQILEEAQKENTLLFFEHDPQIEVANLKLENGQILVENTGDLHTFL